MLGEEFMNVVCEYRGCCRAARVVVVFRAVEARSFGG
jgi:hypothetical protein